MKGSYDLQHSTDAHDKPYTTNMGSIANPPIQQVE